MLNTLNQNIFLVINGFAGISPFLDRFGVILAELVVFIFVLLLVYFWFNKTYDKNIVLFSVFSAILGWLINYVIGLVYFHNRPFMDGLGTNLVYHSASTSFPSDHTTFMLSIAFTLLYFKFTRKEGILLFVLGLISGLSRVFSGVHYPFDIFGSILTAFIASYAIFSLKYYLKNVNMFLIRLYFRFLGLFSSKS